MACKDCIHYDVCGGYTLTDLDCDVFHYAREGRADEIPDIEVRCSDFKDKSRFVELPCKADSDHVQTALRKMSPQFVLCPKGWEGFTRTRYYCPSCKGMTRDHEKFCHKCGQAVKYPKLAHSKTENKLFLDWSE